MLIFYRDICIGNYLPNLADSAAMNGANCSGVVSAGSAPCASSFLAISGSLSAAESAACSLATTASAQTTWKSRGAWGAVRAQNPCGRSMDVAIG